MAHYLPVLFGGVLFALAACGAAKDPEPGPAQPVPVELASVKPLAGVSAVTGTGMIAREREQILSFRWSGVVQQLTVDVGDVVRQGQMIARLDATAVAARLRQAEADQQKAARDLSRDSALAKDGWISPQRLADRQTAVAQARAALDSARFDLKWATLTAPSSGVILVRHIEAGEVVAPGQPVVTIADAASPMILKLPLADRDIARVRLNQAAQVQVTALGDQPLTGTVTRIGERADPRTGTIDVEIRLPANPALKTGYLGTATIAVAANQTAQADRMRVPAEAILEADGGRAWVFVASTDGKTARRVAVGFHGFAGDDALVSGIAAASRVVTRGGAYVRDGGPIQYAAHDGD
jgi:membrane fusion protein, multidrug efflux system